MSCGGGTKTFPRWCSAASVSVASRGARRAVNDRLAPTAAQSSRALATRGGRGDAAATVSTHVIDCLCPAAAEYIERHGLREPGLFMTPTDAQSLAPSDLAAVKSNLEFQRRQRNIDTVRKLCDAGKVRDAKGARTRRDLARAAPLDAHVTRALAARPDGQRGPGRHERRARGDWRAAQVLPGHEPAAAAGLAVRAVGGGRRHRQRGGARRVAALAVLRDARGCVAARAGPSRLQSRCSSAADAEHQATLAYLLQFFLALLDEANARANGLTAHKLATVFAPILLRSAGCRPRPLFG